MGFPDFPVPEEKSSYVPQKSILNFLDLYAQHFGVKPHIKYYNHIKSVQPIANNRWEITSMDIRSKVDTTYTFDAVMVCNGHYNTPNIPKLKGIETFKGQQEHSHNYRDPSIFKNKKVLVIGAGPSGLDLALQISKHAETVILSHHIQEQMTTVFPENIIQCGDIEEVLENEVLLKNQSKLSVDLIFYCTGYKYSFPFLSDSCKIEVDDNYIKPLYKHIVNIEYPTMGLIGVPFYVCTFHMFDLQARFYIEILKGALKLPSKEDMYKDTNEEMEARWARGYTKRQAHLMGPAQEQYYSHLAIAADLKPIPPVMIKLHKESMRRLMEDFVNYRNDVYRIVDENNFVRLDNVGGSCRCQATVS